MERLAIERRKHSRLKYESVVDIQFPATNQQNMATGRVKDIGLGGLKFESCQELATKEISITFKSGSFLSGAKIKGRIIRVQKEKLSFIYGVEFPELKLWQKAKLWFRTSLE